MERLLRANLRGWSSFAPRRNTKLCQQPRRLQTVVVHATRTSEGAAGAFPMLLLGSAVVASLAVADPVSALELHTEPSNALSLPTWAVHVSSVLEWALAIGLMWQFAEVTGNERWKGMSWGMLPCLGSAMAACTWHFFYNSPDLEFLVALQAFLTVVGNCTCWWAAFRIYQAAKGTA